MRNYVPKTVRPAPESAIVPLVGAVSAAYDVPVEDLRGRTRARWAAWPRQTLYLMAGSLFAWRPPRVAAVLNVDTNTVTEGQKAAKYRIQNDATEHQRFRRAMRAYVHICTLGSAGAPVLVGPELMAAFIGKQQVSEPFWNRPGKIVELHRGVSASSCVTFKPVDAPEDALAAHQES